MQNVQIVVDLIMYIYQQKRNVQLLCTIHINTILLRQSDICDKKVRSLIDKVMIMYTTAHRIQLLGML